MIRRDKALKFMRGALFMAQEHSKDRSTKVGMRILDSDDFRELTSGYNGFPRGANDDAPERHERPLKYLYTEHSERNGIFNCVRPLLMGSIAVTTDVPDMSCARAVISVGAKELYYPQPRTSTPELELVLALLAETGVKAWTTSKNKVLDRDNPRACKLDKWVAHAHSLPAHLAKDPHASATLFLDAEDYSVLTQGYSGMPRGADDSKVERYEDPLRQYWVEGSVRNAVYNAARRLLKGGTALVTATPCVECARALAACGVRNIVYIEPTPDLVTRWGEQFKVSLELLEELGVEVLSLSPQEVGRPTVLPA